MILIAKNPPKQDDDPDAEDLQRHLNVVKNKLTGWHLTMKTVLSILDLMPIYERLPLKNTNSKIILLHLTKFYLSIF